VVGYLYNFRRSGRVSAYQSGFTYAAETAQEKPGLCLHALAIERALTVGDAVYDFLAGDDRYKLSLANAQTQLVWVELARPGISGSLEAAGRKVMRSFRGRRR
jgi:CelD/BcsL family acetyltransferase involved in cellulose biosynthesis